MCEIKLLFPVHMRAFFQKDEWQDGLEEIRVRVGQPIEFCYGRGGFVMPAVTAI